jgi:iron(II)-dependent oxidoreductase
MVLTLLSRKKKGTHTAERPDRRPKPPPRPSWIDDAFEPAERIVIERDPLRQCLQLERYGLLANQPERWRSYPDADAAIQGARAQIDAQFAMVPEGFVCIPKTVNDYPGCPEEDFETASFLIARHAVTNAQFQGFVDSGGYQDLDLWPQDIWPHLIDFKDLTGQAAPRFWREGRHDKRLTNHPVVGLSFYEAAAFARWAGYRLPAEPEWQMAASWRIRSSAHVLRRYPWGDALDTQRCNVWATGLAKTAPVADFEPGAAPNGVLQLIGNVWEWTDGDFEVSDDEGHPVLGDMLLKSIRGGAFDTYFTSQATSSFRTGAASLTRAHNIGFRCAIDLEPVSRKGGGA